jgi:hypothetical protein
VIGLLVERFPKLGKVLQYPAAIIVGASRVLPVGGPQARTTVIMSAAVGALYGRWKLQMSASRGACVGAIAGLVLGLTAEFIGKSSSKFFHAINDALRRALGFLPTVNDFTRMAAVLGLLGGAVAGALRGHGRERITDTLFGAVLGFVALGKAAWLAQDLVTLSEMRKFRPRPDSDAPTIQPSYRKKGRSWRTWWQTRKSDRVLRTEITEEKLPRSGVSEEHLRCWDLMSSPQQNRFTRAYEDAKTAITRMCERLNLPVPAFSHHMWLAGSNVLGPSMGIRFYNASGESYICVNLDTAQNAPYSDLVSTMVHELFHAELSTTRIYGKTTTVSQCGLCVTATGAGTKENSLVGWHSLRRRALDEAVSEFLTLHATKASNLSGYRYMEAKLETFNRKLPKDRRDDFLRALLACKREAHIKPLWEFLISVGAPVATPEEREALAELIFTVRLDQIPLPQPRKLRKVA